MLNEYSVKRNLKSLLDKEESVFLNSTKQYTTQTPDLNASYIYSNYYGYKNPKTEI
jgi:hypothetical protein